MRLQSGIMMPRTYVLPHPLYGVTIGTEQSSADYTTEFVMSGSMPAVVSMAGLPVISPLQYLAYRPGAGRCGEAWSTPARYCRDLYTRGKRFTLWVLVDARSGSAIRYLVQDLSRSKIPPNGVTQPTL